MNEPTAISEAINGTITVIIGAIFSYVGILISSYLHKKGFEIKNKQVEQIVLNGIHYAENLATEYAKRHAGARIESTKKYIIAKDYINKRVDSATVKKYVTSLDEAIRRKLQEVKNENTKIIT